MSDIKKKVAVITLGCKVNQYESEAISEGLVKSGYEIAKEDEKCFAYIINTCTVTAESDRKARQMIRRAVSKNPDAYILVAGCYSQTNPDAVAAISGVDYICGSSNKLSVIKKLHELDARGHKNFSAEISTEDLTAAGFEKMCIEKFDRTRAYIKIQDGCESKCTYCVIPSARGHIRSKPFDDVIEEARRLTERGCREVVLTGIETASYGKDLSPDENLAELLCGIDRIENIGRVRLGSLDPSALKPDFIDKISSLKSLAHHFHLSLQSGSDRILALMKRKYNSEQAMNTINLLREAFSDVQLTTDIIVGFPGESDEDFRQTCDFAIRAGFLMIHVFPYSKREGTKAAEMDNQIAENVKHERVGILSALAKQIRCGILDSFVKNNKVTDVLFEYFSDGYMYGHSPEFVEIRVRTDFDLRSQIKKVRIISHNGEFCEGLLYN